MAYVDVSCATCGNRVSVEASVAARMKTCPACGAAIAPAADTAAPSSPPEAAAPNPPRRRLFLLRGKDVQPPPVAETEAAAPAPPETAPADGAAADPAEPRLRIDRAGAVNAELKLCPSCGAVMQLAEKVCTMCGYNTETGRFVQAEHARRERIRRAIAALAVVVILGGLGGLAYRRGAIPKPAEWPRFFLPRPAEEKTETATPPDAPPRTEEEIAALAEAFENSLRLELEEKAPLFIRGEEIELLRADGVAITGVFRGLTHRGTVLLEVDRVLQELPLDSLRELSRVRVDEAFREERIRFEARRRAETGRAE